MPGSNRTAVDGTLAQLSADGRLSPEHGALVQLARSLADAVDEAPGNASLWREYRAAVGDLGRVGESQAVDAFADLLGRLRSPLGDPADDPPEPRSPARSRRRRTRDAADAVAADGG